LSNGAWKVQRKGNLKKEFQNILDPKFFITERSRRTVIYQRQSRKSGFVIPNFFQLKMKKVVEENGGV